MESDKYRNIAFTKYFKSDDNTEEMTKEEIIEKFKNFITNNCKYGIFGLEICPKTKREHLQGFMWLKQSQRKWYLKKFDGNFHFERMYKKWTPYKNKVYCWKENILFEFGDINKVGQGARGEFKERLEQYDNAKELCLDDPLTYCRYRNGV